MKRKGIILGMMIFIAGCMGGCGDQEVGVKDNQSVQDEIEPGADKEDAGEPDNMGDQEPISSSSDNQADSNLSSDSKEDDMDGESGSDSKEDDMDGESSSDSKEVDAQQPSAEAETIYGYIKSLEDGGFSMSKDTVDGDVIASSEDDEIVSVTYTDDTEFEIVTSTDGGITADYSKAASSDLSMGQHLCVVGVQEGAKFVAQKVTIENLDGASLPVQ